MLSTVSEPLPQGQHIFNEAMLSPIARERLYPNDQTPAPPLRSSEK